MSKDIRIHLDNDNIKSLQEWNTYYVSDQNCDIEIISDIEPDWYNEIIQEMESLFKISNDTARDSIKIKYLIYKLKAQSWKDFINNK